jgi:single-stranded-DNA-specific exonuclease
VGIVAGRVADRTGRPTIVVGLEGEAGRGSVRGPAGFPLHDALSRCADTLVGFGGHQAAAGVHVRADRIDALRDAWDDACIELARGHAFAAVREPTVRLFEGDDPSEVVRDFERFEPFGAANPAPLVLLDAARVLAARNLKGHLKLELQLGAHRLGGIAFSRGESVAEAQGRTLQVVASLRRSTFHGGVEVHVERTWPALWR